ncbi:MAG: hypothetical protein AB1861_16875 [Cyanobacteriota bacterium]
MSDEDPKGSEELSIADLASDFLSLKVGEEIPRLKVVSVRKVSNPRAVDNLPGVGYKFLIYTQDNKVLKVNSWTLWKQLSAVFREAGSFELELQLKHTGFQEYSVKLLGKSTSTKSKLDKPTSR